MKRFHLGFGAFFLLVFVLTGQYMDHVHGHLDGMDVGPRLLYRTRHIFILFVALLHLALGTYLQPGSRPTRLLGQWVGSSLIALSGGLFVAGFVYEPGWRDLHTPFTHWGAYSVLAGVLLHAVVGRHPSN